MDNPPGGGQSYRATLANSMDLVGELVVLEESTPGSLAGNYGRSLAGAATFALAQPLRRYSTTIQIRSASGMADDRASRSLKWLVGLTDARVFLRVLRERQCLLVTNARGKELKESSG